MRYLFTVTDRIQIDGRGCVLFPGLPCELGDPILRHGARIRLREPTGSEVDTFVKEIVSISCRSRPVKFAAPILLPQDITKNDVSVGTEVHLLEESYETIQKTN